MNPILDIFTLVIFLGVIQGFFACVFFFTRHGDYAVSNRFLGLLLFVLSCLILEVLLGYSGHITRVIHLVDFSEPMNLLIGPLAYLAVLTRVERAGRVERRHVMHLIPFAVYFAYHLLFVVQNGDYKYNAWLDAWHPDLPKITAGLRLVDDVDPWHLKRTINEWTILSVVVYSVLLMRTAVQAFHRQGLPWTAREPAELAWLRGFALRFVMVVVSVIVVKATFKHDLGDYIIATLITLIVYALAFQVMSRSALFADGPAGSVRKYERSGLPTEKRKVVLQRLEALMKNEKPYLQHSLTLTDLASQLAVSPHHLSQVINDSLRQNFHEYLAHYRVEEARCLLSGEDRGSLRIEAVAEQVGYYSKSSFNSAFKRVTGQTPSQFRDSVG